MGLWEHYRNVLAAQRLRFIGTGECKKSRPVSRVLSWTVIPLGPPSPAGSSNLPGSDAGRAMLPYSVLLRVGFAMPRGVVPARGALLPHRFTLTTHVLRRRSAVCSLLHCPSAHAAQALPGTVPYGARTFLEMLAHLATIRPTRARLYRVGRRRKTREGKERAMLAPV